MRTTLDIQDDVLLAAKELARRGRTSAGQVISDLLRLALTQPAPVPGGALEPPAVHGFRPFRSAGRVVTDEEVEQLREQEGV